MKYLSLVFFKLGSSEPRDFAKAFVWTQLFLWTHFYNNIKVWMRLYVKTSLLLFGWEDRNTGRNFRKLLLFHPLTWVNLDFHDMTWQKFNIGKKVGPEGDLRLQLSPIIRDLILMRSSKQSRPSHTHTHTHTHTQNTHTHTQNAHKKHTHTKHTQKHAQNTHTKHTHKTHTKHTHTKRTQKTHTQKNTHTKTRTQNTQNTHTIICTVLLSD